MINGIMDYESHLLLSCSILKQKKSIKAVDQPTDWSKIGRLHSIISTMTFLINQPTPLIDYVSINRK